MSGGDLVMHDKVSDVTSITRMVKVGWTPLMTPIIIPLGIVECKER